MANTKKSTYLASGNSSVIIYHTIAYVDADETNMIVYDSSVVAALFPSKVDPLNCRINAIWFSTNSAAGLMKLLWDASTKVLAVALPKNNMLKTDFRKLGGLANTGGTGKTGDILLTTSGFTTGESITLVLDVRPS